MIRILNMLIAALFFLFGAEKSWSQARSETELIHRLLSQLQSQNGVLHLHEHVAYATLWEAVLRHPNPDEVKNLIQHPDRLKAFDPVYNENFVKDFDRVVVKGLAQEIHWGDIQLARFELQPMVLTRDLAGLDKIINNRFHGYILVEDRLTRRRYVISFRDMLWMGEHWYGAHLLNILEADSFDEFLFKQEEERKPKVPKPPPPETPAEPPVPENPLAINVEAYYAQEEPPESPEPPGEISERLYFRGQFDEEIEVELYLRGRKGACPEISCFWEGMYKFLDRHEFIKLKITRAPDGTFLMKEQPELGIMELVEEGEELYGDWISTRDGTGYDVFFRRKTDIQPEDYTRMDQIMQFGPWSD